MRQNDFNKFWEFRPKVINPFFTSPLLLRYEEDVRLLVPIECIGRVKNIHERFQNDRFVHSAVLRGPRGVGKTTALNYLRKLILSDDTKKCAVFYCDTGSEMDVQSLRRSVHSSILRKLKDGIKYEVYNFPKEVDISAAEDAIETQNVNQIRYEIYNLIRIYSEQYKKIYLILDHIDNSDPKNWDVVIDYFLYDQGFYNSLWHWEAMPDAKVFVILSVIGEFGMEFVDYINYFDPYEYYIPPWNENDIIELIDKRLHYAVAKEENYNIENYLSNDVLKEITRRVEGNPRECLKICYKLLEEGHMKDIKPITMSFIDEHPFILLTKSSEVDIFSQIASLIRTKYPDEYNKLLSYLYTHRIELSKYIENIVAVYITKKGIDFRILKTLVKDGIVEKEEEETFSLIPQLSRLIQCVYKSLYNNHWELIRFLWFIMSDKSRYMGNRKSKQDFYIY